jgi:hypothetical protein
MNVLYTLFILCIILYLTLWCYVKLFYNFWSLQPVFHYYNTFYWLKSKGVINEELPLVNKYCNFKDIKSLKYIDLTDLDKQFIINFLKVNFLYGENDTYYNLSSNEFISYFENHSHPSFISIYSNNKMIFNYEKNNSLNINEIISVMTTRPLYISLYKQRFMIYYVDHLCVDSQYRKQNIAPQVIQTHEWFQRHNNHKIKASLFKREGKLTGIVPLCVFNSLLYERITCYKIKDPSISIVNITTQTIHLLNDFIKLNHNKFDCMISPHISNMITLIHTKNIYIFIMKKNANIMACYFFKNNCTIYKNKKIIECYGSINNCPLKHMFYNGFTMAYYYMIKLMKTKRIIIENISHNYQLIESIRENYKDNLNLIEESPTAFFLYNYLSHPIDSKKSLIIY